MKCPYVTIFLVAFALQVTNAAPLYNIDSALNELLEMNIRMRSVILRTKFEYEQLKANELKGTLGNIDINKSPISHPYELLNDAAQRIDSLKAFTAESGRSDVDDGTPESVKSFIGRTFDVIGNQFNNWFNKRKITDTNQTGYNTNAWMEDKENDQFGPCSDIVDGENVNSDALPLDESSVDSTSSNGFSSDNVESSNVDTSYTETYSENIFSAELNSNNNNVESPDADKVISSYPDSGNVDTGNAYFAEINSNNSETSSSDNTNLDNAGNTETSNTYSGLTNLHSNNSAAGNFDSENNDNQTEEREQATGNDQATESEQAIGNEQAPDNEQTTDSQQATDNEQDTGNENAVAKEQATDHEEKVGGESEQSWDEETSNNESEDVGWFESTIDSIVNFFS